MKNKTKNKLARNTVRVRKKKRAQEGEKTKKKPNKRLLVRVGSIVACMLLVGALVVPCFADYNPTPNPDEDAPGVSSDNNGIADVPDADVLAEYLNSHNVSSSEPIYKLLNEVDVFLAQTWVIEFTTSAAAIENASFITFSVVPEVNSAVCCYFQPTGTYYIIEDGWWTTSHTTSSGSKFVYFDFNKLVDGTVTRLLRIRYKIDNNSGNVLNIEYEFKEYGTFGGAQMLCATVVSTENTVPLTYGLSLGLLSTYNSIYSNLRDYQDGYSESYEEGYSEGRLEWHERGVDEGHYSGYTNGYFDGYDKGYDDGGTGAEVDSAALDKAYKEGYNKAVSEIDSGEFGENFLGNVFSAPIKALEQFTLVKLPDGTIITIMGVLSAFVALSLFLVFLKKFAGG